MVGIVVVSHSRALARAAVALAEEMVVDPGGPGAAGPGGVRIRVAAGLDDETFGTDAVQIRQAIDEADSGDGVVVLMDLGSAVLSAELALELLDDDDARDRVLLCAAPLVEGLVAAAVTAAGGADRQAVAAEAAAGLAAKQSHLGPVSDPGPLFDPGPPAPGPPADPGPPALSPAVTDEADRPAVTARVTVTPAHGLHARPAARMVGALRGLDAGVEVRNATTGGAWVSAASLVRLTGLGAGPGHELDIRATGPDAAEAVDRLQALAARTFDESPGATAGPDPAVAEDQAAAGDRSGITPDGPMRTDGPGMGEAARAAPAAPGIGIGIAVHLDGTGAGTGADLDAVPDARGDDPAEERRRLDDAIARTRTRLTRLRERLAGEIGSDAEIFDAHLALLDDPDLLADTRSGIDGGRAAAPAWAGSVRAAAGRLESLADPYLRARAADVRAVGSQVLFGLTTVAPDAGPSPGPPDRTPVTPVVLVGRDLTPAEAAVLDPDRVAAVVLGAGSPTAHAAVLARARGVPMVTGAGVAVLQIAAGTLIAVDGTRGHVVLDPPEQVLSDYRQRATRAREAQRAAAAAAHTPAETRDGVTIHVGANVGSADDARAATAAGADLIGLVRTEFLFLNRTQAPDVDEQEAEYRALAEAFDGRIILRTLDVGGDKPLSYLPMPAEANPFLGVRGLRLSLRRPQLLADQLLAVVRVAHDARIGVMFPMVSTLDELTAARAALEAAILREGRGRPAGLEVGIMVEVPSTALKAAAFAPHVDFMSIGTNDLTQYALAAERGNDALAALSDPLDPGVLQLIAATVRGVGDGGPRVAICGELAADEQAVSLLIGLGVCELSVAPPAVPRVKQAVRATDTDTAAALAATALVAGSADAVRGVPLGGPVR